MYAIYLLLSIYLSFIWKDKEIGKSFVKNFTKLMCLQDIGLVIIYINCSSVILMKKKVVNLPLYIINRGASLLEIAFFSYTVQNW